MNHLIKIIDKGAERYTLEYENINLGRQYDHNAEKVVVEFPLIEIEKRSICYMLVSSMGRKIDKIQVFNGEPKDISNVLSQYKKVEIGFTFENEDYVKNSSVGTFTFLEAQKPSDFVPATPEETNKFYKLYETAICNVYKENNTIIFYNIEKREKTRIEFDIPNKTSELLNDSNFAYTNTNNNFSTAQTFNGDITINGNITHNGTTYETHAEQVYTNNDKIILREGATGGLSNNETTGLEAVNYDGEHDGLLVFDATGTARVGDKGDTQPLATRSESNELKDGQVMVWDATNNKIVGSNDFAKKDMFVVLTQEEYDALEIKDSNTFYFIKE